MQKKTLVIFVSLLILSMSGSIAVSLAQDSVYSWVSINPNEIVLTLKEGETLLPLVSTAPNELIFTSKEGETPLSRNLTIVGLSDETVTIKITPTPLYSNNSEYYAKISYVAPAIFQINKTSDVRVQVSVDVSDAKAGTYQGALILTAITAENTTTANIKISSIISAEEAAEPVILAQTLTLLGFVVPIAITLVWRDQWDKKLKIKNLYLIIILGVTIAVPLFVFSIIEVMAGAVYVFEALTYLDVISAILLVFFIVAVIIASKRGWLKEFRLRKLYVTVFLAMIVVAVYIIASLSLVFGDLTFISGALLTPYFAYVIAYVKDKRDHDKEIMKNATTLQSTGLAKSLEFLTSIIGELGNHFASLTSENYVSTGCLSAEKWKACSTTGSIVDIPVGYIAKYYRYIDLHNTYYSVVLRILEKRRNPDPDDDLKKELKKNAVAYSRLIKEFKDFKTKYCELEELTYAYLMFNIGQLGEKYLRPLEIEYPEISRRLLNQLIDYLVKEDAIDAGHFIKKDNQGKEAAYKTIEELKEDIKKLDKNVMDQIKSFIYKEMNRSILRAGISENFDTIYRELENKIPLPYIPKEIQEQPKPTINQIKVDAALKMDN